LLPNFFLDRKWVKVTQKWYGKKWVKLDCGAEVGVLFGGWGEFGYLGVRNILRAWLSMRMV
jgi:hypothetical protein